MDFILDLGETMDIQSINMDFLNAQAQPDWNLLVLPALCLLCHISRWKIVRRCSKGRQSE